MNFAKKRPASGSSYIDLRQHLQICNSLLNIRNHTENNSLIYSFVVGSYLNSSNFQEEEGRSDSLKLRSVEFYQNMSSLQTTGEFAMPMSFNGIDKFETLNDVEVNVIGFENRNLSSMRLSKNSYSSLTLDILPTYESDKHHYVLFNDLNRFFSFIRKKNSGRRFTSIGTEATKMSQRC